MKTCAIIVTGGLLMLLAATAPAFPQTVADGRMGNQADRISQGIRDGSVTADESARLQREQAAIGREE